MALSIIRTMPGRVLRWAPSWECSEYQVLFDAASGDYWVLTSHARQLLGMLQAEGHLEREQLLSRINLPRGAAVALLDNLLQARLVEASEDGVPQRPALAAEPAD